MFQMDVISLFPMEIFYYFTGVNSLLRFPRLLKVGRLRVLHLTHNSVLYQHKLNGGFDFKL